MLYRMWRTPALLLLLTACGAVPAAPAPPEWGYHARVDEQVRTLVLDACFAGQPPERLIPGEPRGRALVERVERVRDGTASVLTPGEDGLWLAGAAPGDCVRFTFDLAALTEATGGRGGALGLDPHRYTAPTLWLWRPATLTRSTNVPIRFELPPGVEVSAPWRRVGPHTWRLDWAAFKFWSRVAIGRFPVRKVPLATGDVMEVASIGPSVRAGDDAVDAWARDAGEGAMRIYGHLPAPRIQFLAVAGPGEGVGLGTSWRGGVGVSILVGRDTGAEGLRRDWTAAHEVLHLGMPHVQRPDAWFYEGVVTYYTYVARARIGRISEQEAWAALHDGFGRGAATGTDRTLREESRDMHRTYAYWRVYWGGAAWALLADVALRRRGRSLDEVMRHWANCCRDRGEPEQADALLRRADDWLGEALLRPLADRWLGTAAFPALEEVYEALGVRPTGRSSVELIDEAPEAGLRSAIMRGE